MTLARDGNVTLSYTLNNQEPKKQLYNKLKSMLGHLGHAPGPPDAAHDVPQERDPDRGRRPPGRARSASGRTRRRSVLDVNCKAHELDNLYVVDTSFFPSIGAVNPALTAIANALRVGDHLLERLGASAGERAGRRP